MASGDTIAKLFVELGFKGQGLKTGAREAERAMSRMGNTVGNVSNMMNRLTVRAFQAGAAAMAAFGVSAAVTGAKFERAMTMVGVLSGETGDNLQRMTDQARELGRTTAFTATEAAEGMQALARAGLSTNQVIQASAPAMHYAGANATSMTNATGQLAATMSQFSMHAYESTRIVDVFTAAINNSLLDTTSLTEAMKYAGTTGHAFGMSLEETTAAVAMFRNLGLEGSQAGTNFRMSMISAARATDRKRQVLEQYKLTMRDINPELHTFEEIMRTIAGVSMSTGDAITVFGARAGANVKILSEEIANNSEDWVQLNDAIANSAGVTEDNYTTMMDTVVGEWDILKSVFQDLQISLFDSFGEGLSDLLQALQELVVFTTQMMTETSGALAGDWGDSMSSMAASIRENKTTIAIQIIEMINFFAELGAKLMWLASKARILIPLFASVFVASKVWAFISAIHVLTTAMIAATGAATGFTVAVNTATAGIPMLIAVGVAATATFFGLSTQMGVMSDGADELAEANRRLAAAIQAVQQIGENYARLNRANTQQALHDMETVLFARGELDTAIESEITRIRELDDAQREQGLTAGQLITVSMDGRDVIVSTALAYRLAQQEGGSYASEMQAGLDGMTARYADGREQIRTWIDETENLAEHGHDIAQRIIQNNSASVEDAAYSVEEFYDLFYYNTETTLKSVTEMWEAMHAERRDQSNQSMLHLGQQWMTMNQMLLDRHRVQVGQSAATEAGFLETVTATRLQMLRERAEEERALQTSADTEAQRRAEELSRKREQAEKARLALFRRLVLREMEMSGRETDYFAQELENRLADTRQMFDDELALYRAHSSRYREIAAQRDAALGMIRNNAYLEESNTLDEIMQTRVDAIESLTDTEAEALEKRHQEEMRQAAVHVANMAESTTKEGDARKFHLEIIYGQLEFLEALHRAEVNGIRRKREEEWQDEQRQIQYDALRQHLPEWMRMMGEHMDEQVAMEGRTQREISELHRTHNAERRALARRLSTEVDQLLNQDASRERRLLLERREWIRRLLPEQMEERAAIEAYYARQLRDARREDFQDMVQQYGFFVALMIRRSKNLSEELQDHAKYTSQRFKVYWEEIGAGPLFDRIRDKFVEMGEDAGEAIAGTGAAQKITGAWTKITDTVGGAFESVWDGRIMGEIRHFGSKAKKPMQYAAREIWKQFSAFGKGAIDGILIGFGAIGKGVKVVIAGLKGAMSVAQAVGRGFGVMMSGLEKISGFAFSLTDAAAEVAGLMEQRQQADADLAAGKMTSAEYMDATEGLPATIEEAASTFVTDLISGSITAVETLVTTAPIMLQELARQAPELLKTIAGQLPILIDGIVSNLKPVFDAITKYVPEIAMVLIGKLPEVATAIVSMLPSLLSSLLALLPSFIEAAVQAMVAVIEIIPELVARFVAEIPYILEAVVQGLGTLISALLQAIPVILGSIIEGLPSIIAVLVQEILGLVILLVNELPSFIAAIIELIPVLIEAVITMIPWIIGEILVALPEIVDGLIAAIPVIIDAIIESIPLIITMLIDAIPQLVHAVVFVLIPELIKAAAEFAIGVVSALWTFFSDLIKEIFTLGKAETETFGDTPGMVKAGARGMMARFSPGDFVIAAKRKEDVLKQAVSGISGAVGSALGGRSPSLDVPQIQGLGAAVMQSGSSSGGSSQPLRVTVTAEGRTLDDVLYVAGNRGGTPKLQKSIRKSSGATLGFSRGRFSSSS